VTENLASEFDAACRSVADERYRGVFDRGFAHLSLQLSFPDVGLSDDEADEAISIDRTGDLGVDTLSFAESERTILIFQSKSTADYDAPTLQKDISDFLGVIRKLESREWRRTAHSELRSLANEFLERVSDGYRPRLVFATRSRIPETVESSIPIEQRLTVGGREVIASVIVLGLDELSERYRKLLLDEYESSTDVQFAFRRSQCHEPPSTESVVYVTLTAREFINACKDHEQELFRYNPRLYLGENKVNQRIATTLANPAQRKYFHLLNNGITAVCRDYTIVDAGDDNQVMHVENFQVVNGCQTTMTLFRHSADVAKDDECLLDVKIIKSEGLRGLISEATNTQTAIVAEDAVANDQEQEHIRLLLDRHSPPYYYAPKRGMWERLPTTRNGKRKYLDEQALYGKHRKVTSKELASVSLAILGEPEAAKDRPRIVFERTNGEPSQRYRDIFLVDNIAAQWLLPVELHRRANAFLKKLEDESGDSNEERVGKYARYRMVWLAYRFLAEVYDEPFNGFLSARVSEKLLDSVEGWADPLLEIAHDALVDAYTDAVSQDLTTGLREFFRERKHQEFVIQKFDANRRRTGRLAERKGETLLEYLGLP